MPGGEAFYQQCYWMSFSHYWQIVQQQHLLGCLIPCPHIPGFHAPPSAIGPQSSTYLGPASASGHQSELLLFTYDAATVLGWCTGQSTAEHTQGMMMTMRKWAKREPWGRTLPWGPRQEPHPRKNSHSLDRDLHSAWRNPPVLQRPHAQMLRALSPFPESHTSPAIDMWIWVSCAGASC